VRGERSRCYATHPSLRLFRQLPWHDKGLLYSSFFYLENVVHCTQILDEWLNVGSVQYMYIRENRHGQIELIIFMFFVLNLKLKSKAEWSNRVRGISRHFFCFIYEKNLETKFE
jgi:hypothetical protein